MTTNTAYRIENLDVYRKSITLGTRLYQAAGNGKAHSVVGERVRENTLALVLNLASGLGFWEKQWKTSHFAASKRAVMEMTPLLELMVALGEMKAEAGAQYATELQDLTKMIGGLLRQSQRREGCADEGGPPPEGIARERSAGYQSGAAEAPGAVVRFEKGSCYTRVQIHDALGGSWRAALPTRGGRVVCACLTRGKNPRAPEEMVIGADERGARLARAFAASGAAVPVFVRARRGGWEFAGERRVRSVVDEPGALLALIAEGAPMNVSLALVLEEEAHESCAADAGAPAAGMPSGAGA
jgi:hypothetical protein